MTTPAADLAGTTVAVLMGGRSGEREVSLDSGREALAALSDGAPEGSVLGVEIGLDGHWTVGEESLPGHEALARLEGVGVFFLALHGGDGEDGTIQGLLECSGKRYTGSGVRASALCMDKQALRLLAAERGLRVAPAVCFSRQDWVRDEAGLTARMRTLPGARRVVKPRCGGSSVCTFLLEDPEGLADAVTEVLERYGDVLVETFVTGVEVSCAVLGNADEVPRALPAIEIRPKPGRFFDYQQKYDTAGALEICPPESLGPQAEEHVRRAAEEAHSIAGCDGYSRVDFIVAPDGAPFLLEVNTLPGLTPRSLLPQEAAVMDLSYRELCLFILGRALARRWSFE